MSQLKVTQIKSPIGGTHRQRATLKALGLKRIRDEVVIEDRPELRGMVVAVAHLVSVEDVAVEDATAEDVMVGDPTAEDLTVEDVTVDDVTLDDVRKDEVAGT